jgi:hypothetical protein
MSLIPGTNITLQASQLVTITSGLILRSISGPSTDTFDTANNFAVHYFGGMDPSNNGASFTLLIYNTDPINSITMLPGTGMTFNPLNPLANDTIPPNQARTYYFIQTAAVLGVSVDLAIYAF